MKSGWMLQLKPYCGLWSLLLEWLLCKQQYQVSQKEYSFYVDVINGHATFENIFETGNYTVVATYMGDERYGINSTSKNFIVVGHVKKDTPVTADVQINGNNVTLTVTVNENATGFVKVNIGTTVVNLELVDGVATLTIKLASNSYLADIIYLGDENYNTNATKLAFVVEKGLNNIQVIVEDTTLPSDVSVRVVADIDDTYVVTIGDKTVDVVVKDGEGIATIALPVGEGYTATTSWENENYTANITDAVFNVVKGEPSIVVTAETIKYGDDLVVIVTSSDDFAYCVNVTVGDQSQLLRLIDGKGTLKFSGLVVWTYTVVALYKGDAKYVAGSANTTVEVKKAVPKDLIIVTQDISYGEDLIVNVILSDPIAYRINVTVGDQSQLLRLKDGKGTLKFSGLAVGTYAVAALYKGDAKYSAVSADTFVEVKKANPNMTVSAKTSGKYVVVDVSSDDEVANLINVTVGNQFKLVSLSEGQGTVNFTDFEAGTYTVTATYKGDNNYSAVSVDTTVEVKWCCYEQSNWNKKLNIIIEK